MAYNGTAKEFTFSASHILNVTITAYPMLWNFIPGKL